MFMPCIPSRPADIYTVRIEEHEAQTSLTLSLRKLVVAAGGTFIVNLTEGPGFIFTMPTAAPSPLTSYLNGRLLEEGCVHISKTTLEKEQSALRMSSPIDEDTSDADSVEDEADHPNLRMQWRWTELKKDGSR